MKKSFQAAKCYGVTDEERKAAEEVEEQEKSKISIPIRAGNRVFMAMAC